MAEYNTDGAVTNRYVHGVGADTPNPRLRSRVLPDIMPCMIFGRQNWYQGSAVNATTRRHLFANWQGSISLVTNATGFTVLGINAYDGVADERAQRGQRGIPKGTATSTTADDNIGRFQYTGQIWIPELGMYYYKARIHSPTLGRFLQTDPIGYEDQVNLYAYVGNDPVNMVDPTGMYECKSKEDCAAAAAGVNDIKRAKSAIDAMRSSSKDLKTLNGLKTASAALGQALKSLGSENDGNGLTVQEGTPTSDPNARGEYDSNTRTITLSLGNIAKSGSSSIGGVLAHEVEHDRERNLNLNLFEGEHHPLTMQYLVDKSIGAPTRYGDYGSYIRGRLIGYCSVNLPKYCQEPVEQAIRTRGKVPI